MLKYSGDLMEKLTADALVVGLFEGKGAALFLGFIFFGVWITTRRKEERP